MSVCLFNADRSLILQYSKLRNLKRLVHRIKTDMYRDLFAAIYILKLTIVFPFTIKSYEAI